MTAHSSGSATPDPVVQDAATKIRADITMIASTANNMTPEQVSATLAQVATELKATIDADKAASAEAAKEASKVEASAKPASGAAGAQSR